AVQGSAIVRIVEDRDQDDAVGDVEVGVAGGEAASFENHGAGHGEFNNSERFAVLIGGGSEAADVFAQRLVVRIGGIGLDGGDDGVGGNEAGGGVHGGGGGGAGKCG